MVYTPYSPEFDEARGNKVWYWFALIPDQNLELGFDTEADLLTYVHKYGIKNPAWRTPDDILKEYDQTWCLDWIPACN